MFLCCTLEEAETAFTRILGKRNGLGLINESVLVQEFLVGKEYVIDKVQYHYYYFIIIPFLLLYPIYYLYHPALLHHNSSFLFIIFLPLPLQYVSLPLLFFMSTTICFSISYPPSVFKCLISLPFFFSLHLPSFHLFPSFFTLSSYLSSSSNFRPSVPPPPPIFPLLLHSFSFSSFCLLSYSSLFLLFPSFLFPTFRFLGMVCTRWLQSGNMTRGRSMVQTLSITVCV